MIISLKELIINGFIFSKDMDLNFVRIVTSECHLGISILTLGNVIIKVNTLPYKIFNPENNSQLEGVFLINFMNRSYHCIKNNGAIIYDCNIDNLSNYRIKLDIDKITGVPLNGDFLKCSHINIYRTNYLNRIIRLNTTNEEIYNFEQFDASNNTTHELNENLPNYNMSSDMSYSFTLHEPLNSIWVTLEKLGKVNKKINKKFNMNKIIELKDKIQYNEKEYIVNQIKYKSNKFHPKDLLFISNQNGERIIKYRSSCKLIKKYKIHDPQKKKSIKISEKKLNIDSFFLDEIIN